jgi:hypothetical protein
MRYAENAGLKTRKHKTSFDEMLNTIGDSLRNLASLDARGNSEDEDDDNEHTVLGKWREDDEPSWVMGTISTMVQYWMECFRHQLMKLTQFTQKDGKSCRLLPCER